MTESDVELERMYRTLDYASHRLAQENIVVGRLQSVASTFIAFSISAIAAVIALEITDYILLYTVLFSLSALLISSVLMIRASMTQVSETRDLGKTAWFNKGNNTSDGKKSEGYKITQSNEDLVNFREILQLNEADWKNDCSSHILQLFNTQKARMVQIENMNAAFRKGMYTSVFILVIGFIVNSVLFTLEFLQT
ncbi:MAG: hypothetical protein KAR03_07315 [Candidatus Thorarchaeota archaeon]|nr:hypothetical protein [Candidatus Thorarchaeota archaeon]